MTVPRLLTIPEAAKMLGLPARSLMLAAERHGHLIRVGRAVRIPEAELGELIEKCKTRPKVQMPPSAVEKAQVSAAQVRETVEMLKAMHKNRAKRSPEGQA